MSRPSEDDQPYLRLATIGAPRGLAGQLRLRLHTDDPESRLAAGTVLTTEPAESGPLEVAGLRRIQQHWYVTFVGITDRTGAEALRGVLLLGLPGTAEPEAWYPHELAGLRADHVDGRHIGEVTGLRHAPGHDLLMIKETAGGTTAVPFVSALVPEVDVPGGRVVLDPPRGLLAADPLDDEPDPED